MTSNFYTTILTDLYGAQAAGAVEERLQALLTHYRGHIPAPTRSDLTEKDVMLITYGDQVRREDELPLQTLANFCEQHLDGIISDVHLLPFFPWSSDDGFAIKDYRQVDPALGSWADIERFGHRFGLMIDGVINHTSVESEWFQAFLRDEAPYRDYFLTVSGTPDLSLVVRPRTLPLLHEYLTTSGPRQVWTTFSADQVDLDYHNPNVLLEIFDILLGYVQRGARFIRLDAIAYLWKEIGTTCIHLPQTHAIVQLLHAILADVAPYVRLITETNVPHRENLSYFGNGANEANLIYNFALPPLVLHTFRSADTTILTDWAAGLQTPSAQTTFFNFLASHDGIGLNPARGILAQSQIDALVSQTLAHGGHISYKENTDGSQSPYELNINYFDALSDPCGSLRGLPGIYFHSLFGSRNWTEGVALSGQARSINRQKLNLPELENDLNTSSTLRALVFDGYRRLLQQRAASPAFHPLGEQEVLHLNPSLFMVRRTSPDGREKMLCLHNVSGETQSVDQWILPPYETLWIKET
jgi:sucrose phosphorylase